MGGSQLFEKATVVLTDKAASNISIAESLICHSPVDYIPRKKSYVPAVPALSACQRSWHSSMMACASATDVGVSEANEFSALPSDVLYILSQSTSLAVMPGLT